MPHDATPFPVASSDVATTTVNGAMSAADKAKLDAIPAGGGITQLTGPVTAGPGSGSQGSAVTNNAITNAMIRQSGALAVVGRSANSTGNVADIQATAASDGVLRESGSTVGFGTIATAGIADAAVTLAKMANLAQSTIVGRASGAGTGVPTALSAGQVSTVLGLAAIATSGSGADLAAGTVANAALANMAQSTIKGRASGAGTGVPTDLSAAQVAAILSIATTLETDAGANGTDLTVSGLSGQNKTYEVEFRIVTASGSGANFSMQPNAVATNQASTLLFAGSSSGSTSLTVLNLGDSTGTGYIFGTARFTQRNTQNWQWTLQAYQNDGGSVLVIVASGEWAVTTAITSLRLHGDAANSIRTNSFIRVREVFPA